MKITESILKYVICGKLIIHDTPFCIHHYSGDKLVSLYEELQTNEASPHLLSQYEEVMSALMSDVKKIDESKRKMEEKIKK